MARRGAALIRSTDDPRVRHMNGTHRHPHPELLLLNGVHARLAQAAQGV
jgi:hypothetical protein